MQLLGDEQQAVKLELYIYGNGAMAGGQSSGSWNCLVDLSYSQTGSSAVGVWYNNPFGIQGLVEKHPRGFGLKIFVLFLSLFHFPPPVP